MSAWLSASASWRGLANGRAFQSPIASLISELPMRTGSVQLMRSGLARGVAAEQPGVMRPTIEFVHADVFASAPYRGNSVAVVYDSVGLDAAQMLAITRELRHFETIFVRGERGCPRAGRDAAVRVCDLFGELPFAGHPTLGAAVALQHDAQVTGTTTWTLRYPGKSVPVTVQPLAGAWHAELDAGQPAPSVTVPTAELPRIATAFGLSLDDLSGDLPVQVGSTGLRYLVVPLVNGLDRASVVADLTPLLASLGADFAYLVDVDELEGRHWNNDGDIEDVATGSAASVVGAYLVRHGRVASGHPIELRQGRFVDRPSTISVTVDGPADQPQHVRVGGQVHVVATGTMHAVPERTS